MLYNNPLCQLYVGELNPNINEEVLFGAFSRFGRIMSMKVMRHIATGASRGFAFINFSNPNEASKAKLVMNGQKFFEKNLKIYLKTEYDVLDQNANVVVQGLPEGTAESDLMSLIASLSKPFSTKIVKNDKKTDESKAYMQFENMEQASAVIQKLNGTTFQNKQLSAEFTNRKNKVFIKAKHHNNAIEELKNSLQGWKFEELEAPELSTDNTHFIVMIKFENEETANQFLEDVDKNPSKYPLIVKAVDKTNLKSLKTDFQSASPFFFCRIAKLKHPEEFEKFKTEIARKFEQTTGVRLIESSEDSNEVEITFANSKGLMDLILSIQKKDPQLIEFFHADSLKVDFPHFMVAVIRKAKMATKKNTFKPWEGSGLKNINIQQPWPQQPILFQNVPIPHPMSAQAPFPFQINPVNKQQPQPAEFKSMFDVSKIRKEYLALPDDQRNDYLSKLLRSKMKQFPQMVDLSDVELTQKVLSVLMDSEAIDQMDLIEAFGNNEDFENLLKQAIEY